MQDEENAALNPCVHQSSHERQKSVHSETVPCQRKPFLALRSCLAGPYVSLTKLTGWRRVVAGGSMCMILALLLNVALLIWACTKPKSDSGTFILFSGDCNKTKSTTTWSHLGINIISTLILSGSNYAIQILAAPTRDNADVAHRSGRSVTIGAPSFSNFKFIDNRRRFLYLCLAITSIPFHTMYVFLYDSMYKSHSDSYNSIVFDTTSAIDLGMFLVTNDFFDDPPTSNYSSSLSKDLDWIWKSASTWTNLTVEDCFSRFSATYVHDFKNVVLVTNVTSASNHDTWLGNTTRSQGEFWLCEETDPQTSLCDHGWAIYYATSFTWYQWYTWYQLPGECEGEEYQDGYSNCPYSDNSTDPHFKTALVQYCLAQPVRPSCTVELSPQLLVVSIICNFVKIVALLVLLHTVFDPLVTIGDAITSFLNDPDLTTESWGVISADHEYECRQRWKGRQSRYFSGVRWTQWLWPMFLCLPYLLFGITMIRSVIINVNPSINPWQYSPGDSEPSMVESWDFGFVNTVLIVNLPQLVLSITYLSYNSLLTRLLLSREWTSYVRRRKGLRVTRPEGQQRSTYFLSLPYTFSVPLLIFSTVLHWALSQSFFLVQVNYTTNDGQPIISASILTAGFSIVGLMIAVSIGASMIIALISLGFWRYKSGIPLVQDDSRAISAACHSTRLTKTPESLQKLRYGVIADLGQDKYLVGLSSGPVHPLEDGKLYDYHPCLVADAPKAMKIERQKGQYYHAPLIELCVCENAQTDTRQGPK